MKNIVKTPVALLFVLLIAGCGAMVANPHSGVQDAGSANLIKRINELSALRRQGNYSSLSSRLESDLSSGKFGAYGQARIQNELADIYSFQQLDIERAMEIDQRLARDKVSDADSALFVPVAKVASQQIVADNEYFEQYIKINARDIAEQVKQRVETNERLLSGGKLSAGKKYTRDFLENHIKSVRADIVSTPQGSPARYRILSRLIRADLELSSAGRTRPVGEFRIFLDGTLPLSQVDLTEISFLQLADYLSLAYKASGEIRYAEMALETVYRPYVNLRNPNYRWNYNKLINDYISTLIEANYQADRFDEMLYYISLNKSRMLLEERLAYAKGGEGVEAKVSDLTVNDGIPRSAAGLPEKSWFKQRLAAAGPYIDFYVGGKYMAQSAGAGQTLAKLERSTMPLTTRDFGVEDASIQADAFVDDVLYVTEVKGGKIVAAKKVSGKQLGELKGQLDDAYQKISSGARQGYEQSRFFKTLLAESGLPEKIVISPDKWLARHPLDFHLGAKATRSVNFFTVGGDEHLANLRVSGFFNPTLDLNGAEQEADAIRAYIPDAQIFKREEARLAALQSVAGASVLHLSMHGQFNANDPRNSRLAFAGAVRGGDVTADPNSLYARDMYKYAALKDRDLIFAAACQTGLSAAGQTNENELMGILRPLTANRNKNIILSLWDVDDAATKEFVTAFYQRLAESKDVDAAFHHAQDVVRGKYSQPYYWAAFYLSKSN